MRGLARPLELLTARPSQRRPAAAARAAGALVAVALVCLLVPGAAHAASFRSCNPNLLYAPKNGGYGLIVRDLHVRRVSCPRGLRIGGGYLAGDGIPKGWGCHEGFPWTKCRYRHTHRMLRFIFEGDAG
jgi:hypothetical protein